MGSNPSGEGTSRLVGGWKRPDGATLIPDNRSLRPCHHVVGTQLYRLSPVHARTVVALAPMYRKII